MASALHSMFVKISAYCDGTLLTQGALYHLILNRRFALAGSETPLQPLHLPGDTLAVGAHQRLCRRRIGRPCLPLLLHVISTWQEKQHIH